jgi:hypothetical protein
MKLCTIWQYVTVQQKSADDGERARFLVLFLILFPAGRKADGAFYSTKEKSSAPMLG